MKNLTLLLLILISSQISFCQSGKERIIISNNLELVKLSENSYIHISYLETENWGRIASNGLIYINGKEAFLFDTPMSSAVTKELVYWIKDSMKVNIVGFVPNHWHADCMGGLDFILEQRIPTYANQMTIESAKKHGLKEPENGFKDSILLNLGEEMIFCYYPGPAHSNDNIAVWLPAEKLLFAGCMIKSLDASNLGNTTDGDIDAYADTIEKIKTKFTDALLVVPGHGQHGGSELIDHTLSLARKEKM